MAIGSALALKGTDRLPVAVIGDGDYMMGVNALWTAANAQIPMLMVVCNNRSFFNDELHQERMARQRSRPVENRWIGQRIANPEPDLAMMARAQGLTAFGPVEDSAEFERVLVEAIALVKGGATVVIDAVVLTGYSPSMTAGLTRAD
jgi:thiamine pyrophosphate-dependent acetolactate synthase large subunit-like protein